MTATTQTSKLKRVLMAFEQADGPLMLSAIARDLDVSMPQLESMIQYWVRKGAIRESVAARDCGTCGIKGECPFVMEMPRSYELKSDLDIIPLQTAGSTCGSPGCNCH